ncbi:hypothetical protein [Haloglomus litoreum]|uniref:hypothetical protein n=1 Tax=Haloglomus litoreum TaxID=3034026 RepID=UPI0023E880FD|nr:hypothetical protein [Haloglomus sp. DT116]
MGGDADTHAVPDAHRITAAPHGEAILQSIAADGTALDWDERFGRQHYRCSCGETFDDRHARRQIVEHLAEVGVLEWDAIDEGVVR